MKKIIIALLALALALSLIACGEKPEKEDTPNTDAEQGENKDGKEKTPDTDEGDTAPDTYVASVNGTDVWVKADMTQIKAKLGEPTSYFESESCAFRGLDKVYTYGSTVIRTYPEGDKDYVLNIELKDDSVTTKEGAYIGASKDEIITAYGAATEESTTALIYKKGGTDLTFLLTNDSVSSITYTITD